MKKESASLILLYIKEDCCKVKSWKLFSMKKYGFEYLRDEVEILTLDEKQYFPWGRSS